MFGTDLLVWYLIAAIVLVAAISFAVWTAVHKIRASRAGKRAAAQKAGEPGAVPSGSGS